MQGPEIGWLSESVFFRTDYKYCDSWGSLDEPPFIVPPVAAKSPLAEPCLREIWGEARHSLIEGDPVWIIGYSLPADDPQARVLLRSSLTTKQRYHVVDPDVAVGERYFVQVGSQVEFRTARFTKDLLEDLFRDHAVPPPG